MKALRIVLAVFGGILALLIIAAIIFVNSFDANDYKDEITAYVQERTGRTLVIERDIELSLFPWFAVETGGVTLSDDPGFGERSFIAIDHLSARVRVLPLLRRQVEIGRVTLDGVELRLGVDAAGRGNWTSLVGAKTPAAASPAATSTEPRRPLIEGMAAEGLELRNTRIVWQDAAGETRYLVRDLRLASGPIRDTDPVQFELEFVLLDVATQATAAIEIEARAALAPDPILDRISARIRVRDSREQERVNASLTLDSITRMDDRIRTTPLEIHADLTEPPTGPASLSVTLGINSIELNTQTEGLVVNGLRTRTGGLEASWNLSGSEVLSAPHLTGSVELESRSIAELFDLLGAEPPTDVDLARLGGVTGSAAFSLGTAPRRLELERFAITALGVEARGNASLLGDGGLRAGVELPAFRPTEPLRDLLLAYVPEGTDLAAVTSVSASVKTTFSADRHRLQISEFAVALDTLRFAGQLTVDEPAGPATIAGKLTAQGLDNRLLTALLGPLLPAELSAAPLGEFRLATQLEYSAAAQSAVLDPLELSAYGLTGAGQLTVDTSGSSLALSGQARLSEFSPRALLGRFNLPVPESSDPGVFRSAELAAAFATTGDSGRFRNIALRLDESMFTGEFSVDNFADPTYAFVLRGDRVDADRYLPPQADAATDGGASTPDERTLGEIGLATEPLNATRISGTATIAELTIGGMRFEQLATDLAVGDGRGELSSVSTNLYGGSFTGSVAVDATGETPSLHLTGNAAGLAMDPLLTAILGGANLSGTGSFQFDLTGRGDTVGAAVATAAGTVNLALSDGAINGVNVGRSLCATVNRARDLPPPQAAPDTTRFSLIRGSASVSDGVLASSDLFATTDFVQLTGKGQMRLVDQWLDTDFVARLTGAIPLTGCERLNSQIDDSIPIGFSLTGTLPDVDVGFDISQLIEDWLKREIRNQTQDAIRDRVQDALRGLLN